MSFQNIHHASQNARNVPSQTIWSYPLPFPTGLSLITLSLSLPVLRLLPILGLALKTLEERFTAFSPLNWPLKSRRTAAQDVVV